jgi:hypothetical protein
MLYTPELPFYDSSLEELPEVNPLEGLREYLRFVDNVHIGTPDREAIWTAHRRTADAYGADVLSQIRRGLASSDTVEDTSRTLSLEVQDFASETLPHDIAAYYKALHLGQSRLEDVESEPQPQTARPGLLRLAKFAVKRAVFPR